VRRRVPLAVPAEPALVITAAGSTLVDLGDLDEAVRQADLDERPQLTLAGFYALEDRLVDELLDLWPVSA
jgi:hypothetical protein